MKDAHCTESLAQLPPTDTGFSGLAKLRPVSSIWASLLLCLYLASPLLEAQTTTEPKAETEKSGEMEESTSATTPEEPETPLYQSREERDMTLLADDVDGETAVWLTAMEQPFLGLYERELTGQAVGAVLIINAEGQHSSWPTTSELIRLSLPEFGWNTLSTELPLPETRPVPKRSETPNPTTDNKTADEDSTESPEKDKSATETEKEPVKAEAGEDKEIYDSQSGQLSDGSIDPDKTEGAEIPEAKADEMKVPAEDIAVARLHAAINYLHQQGQFNIVLMGSGMGALRSVCFLNDIPKLNESTQSRLIRSLVMINARNRLPNDDRQLHKCLDTPEMPVLDVYVGQDDRNQSEAKERRKYAHRKNYEVYQQIRLPELARNTMLGENRLSRRVRGFLESHSRGVKIDNAVIKKP
mgnify:CR=1 FL=1